MKQPSRSAGATKKRKISRDADSGQFAQAGALEPDELVRMVRAIKDLEPFLAGAALAHKLDLDEDEQRFAQGYAFVGFFLAELKQQALRELTADPESLKEAKKLRIDAKRLGNVPLQEQERVRNLANNWLLTPDVTPRSLLSDAMRSAGLLALKEVPKALP